VFWFLLFLLYSCLNMVVRSTACHSVCLKYAIMHVSAIKLTVISLGFSVIVVIREMCCHQSLKSYCSAVLICA